MPGLFMNSPDRVQKKEFTGWNSLLPSLSRSYPALVRSRRGTHRVDPPVWVKTRREVESNPGCPRTRHRPPCRACLPDRPTRARTPRGKRGRRRGLAMEIPTSTASRPDFYDFLDCMRRPAAADLFRSIKSFLVSSFHAPNAEEDSSKVQAFLAEMESAIRDHPLWTNATSQEIDHALEGLEKYVMTKLFDRTFGTSIEDADTDMEVSEKIGLLQQFVKPHHLDIPKVLHNEASWLLAVKELQKINSFKAPREKLLCIMSCCQVINNLLLNISMSNDRTLSGADEFLPVLIYVTIKANPPQLHSNLKFVQLFRRETKLISEVEYYLTNLISAKMFIIDVNARSLSMEESEFEKHMESARLATQVSVASPSSSQGLPTSARANQEETDIAGSRFPFMDSETESLTPGEVKQLHDLYRQVVTRYTLLSEALRKLSIDEDQLLNSVHDS